ncbi:MAG: transglycosylase SLT domain-containing protein [Rhodobacteraceae bacterium]|nr:transglycosylase SLT domain-containing protein [Paracoccaceae bacterium]
MRIGRIAAIGLALMVPVACVPTGDAPDATRAETLPAMRWDHLPQAERWTGAVMQALATDGEGLAETVPADIGSFCPGYETASMDDRRAFWAGLLSALAEHESTWNPKAKGGGGRWIGLLQIAPGTAKTYGCDLSGTGGLTNGAANLACAVRIATHQVTRDGAIVSDGADSGWRGVARDWAPMRKAAMRSDMAAWTRQQSYCTL